MDIQHCCSKLVRQHQLNQQQALMYLKLRAEGCESKQARQYCSRNLCLVINIDQTKTRVGPKGFKLLKIEKDQKPSLKGWQSAIMTKYNLGRGYKQLNDFDYNYSSIEKKILNKYKQLEETKEEELKKKVNAVNQYLQQDREVKLKYNKKKKGEYLNKIKNLCKKNAEKEEELSKYMKYKGNKYYYVSDLIKKELEEKEQLDLKFQSIGQDQEDNQNNEVYKQLSKIIKSFNPLIDTQNNELEFVDKRKKKNYQLKCKSYNTSYQKSFNQILQESQLILNLLDTNGISEVLDKEKIKSSSQLNILSSIKNSGIQKNKLAQEFNDSQYLFHSKIPKRNTYILIKNYSQYGKVMTDMSVIHSQKTSLPVSRANSINQQVQSLQQSKIST